MLPLDLVLFERTVDISAIAASRTASSAALTHSSTTPITLRLKTTRNGLASRTRGHHSGLLDDNLAYPEKLTWECSSVGDLPSPNFASSCKVNSSLANIS